MDADLLSTPDLVEVADRVWVARHPWYDVNVTVVVGGESVLVVDTHVSEQSMAALLPAVRRVSSLPVAAVLATHEHHDHVLGAGALLDAWPGAAWVAHEEAARGIVERLPAQHAEALEAADASGGELTDRQRERLRLTATARPVPPTQTFSSAWALDLGDRLVEAVHPGRGHTAGDVVVRVDDARLLVAGDLVEESAAPAYGADCWPLDWPATLDVVLQLLTPGDTVVPGHGAPVDRAFVEDQRDGVGAVAETVRGLAAGGVPADRALAEGSWPFPAAGLEQAVRRAYAHLPPGGRSLPMA